MALKRFPRIEIVLTVIALVLGVGVVTFFLGPDDATEVEDVEDYVELDLSTVKGSDVPAEEVLWLPWGDGEQDASRKGDPLTSTIEAVFSSEGYVFIVDHPEGLTGARVRWFSGDGDLAGTWMAPSGSTFFAPHAGGFCYIIAKAGHTNETAAIHDVLASADTTYSVPLELNSGGLAYNEGVLYARVTPSSVDIDAEEAYSREVLVPVAVNGVQVDDTAADAQAMEAWGWGFDGKMYLFSMRIIGINDALSNVVVMIGAGDLSVRVPSAYRLLGVTADSGVCLTRATYQGPIVSRPVQFSALDTSSHDPLDEVIVMDMAGTIRAVVAVPYSSDLALYDDSLPMSLCSDGLYTLRADERGVTVVRYRL